MAQRIDALVNVNMTRRKAAAVIGCLPSEVVQFGNGYAVIEPKKTPADTVSEFGLIQEALEEERSERE